MKTLLIKQLLAVTLICNCLSYAQQDFEQGKKLLADGHLQQAMSYFQREWTLQPDNTTIRYKIMLCSQLMEADGLYNRGDYQQALEIYNQVDPQYLPEQRIANINKILDLQYARHVAQRKGDAVALRSISSQLSAVDPGNPALRQEALQEWQKPINKQEELDNYIKLGNWQKAGEESQQLWALAPENLRAKQTIDNIEKYFTAEKLHNEARYPEAIEIYYELLEKYPKNRHLNNKLALNKQIQSLVNEGDLALQKQDYAKALASYSRVITISSQNITAKQKINDLDTFTQNYRNGMSLISQRKFSEALKPFSKNQELWPGHIKNEEALFICKQIEQARIDGLHQARPQYLNQLNSYEQLLALAEGLNEVRQEVDIAKEIIRLRESASTSFMQSNYLKAKNEYFELLKINPLDQSAKTYYQLSKKAEETQVLLLSKLAQKDYKQAWELFRELKKLNYRESSSYYQLPAEW